MEIKINVNGKDIKTLSVPAEYEDLVSLAFPEYSGDVLFSIAVDPKGEKSFLVAPGQKINLKDGMIINVSNTSAA